MFGGLLQIAPAIAQVRPGLTSAATSADFQVWNELDVTARLAQSFELTWVSIGRFSSQVGGPVTYAEGIEANLRIGKHLVLIPSYYVYGTYSATTGWRSIREPLLDVTIEETAGRCKLTDRSRILHEDGVEVYWVYRNRLWAECSVGPERWGASLFVWDGAYYYSNYHGWTRNRFGIGGRVAINSRWALDLYYLRQVDERSQPREIHGIGMTLQWRVGNLCSGDRLGCTAR